MVVARYAIRPDEAGWTVVDRWLDEPASFDGRRQTGLPFPRAEMLAGLLNWRAERGEIFMLQ